jgi:hypothetical protein
MEGRTRPPPPPRPPGQERRREPRNACSLQVEVLSSSGLVHIGRTLDLSLGGACLEVPAALIVGQRVRLRFRIPGASQPIAAEGDIRWARDLANGFCILGLSLLTLPTEEAAELRRVIDELP